MTFSLEVFSSRKFAPLAASWISARLPVAGSLVVTGGPAAAAVYAPLVKTGRDWSRFDVFFSDERCVPPEHEQSNFRMVNRDLLEPLGVTRVHRMEGELSPSLAAERYEQEVRPAAQSGFAFMILGLGDNAHIAALFPRTPALHEAERFCVAVERPSGLEGITLTPLALLPARKIALLATGESTARAVHRTLRGTESPEDCPARLLAANAGVTLLVDEDAASLL